MAKKSPFSDSYRDLPCTTVLKKDSQSKLKVCNEFSDPKNIECANTVLDYFKRNQQKPQPREHA